MVTRKRMIQINRESVRMTYRILHDKLSFGTVFRRITCFLEIVYSVIHGVQSCFVCYHSYKYA